MCYRLSRPYELILGSMNKLTSYLNCSSTVNMLPAASMPADFYIWIFLFKQCSALPYRAYLYGSVQYDIPAVGLTSFYYYVLVFI